ncbi:hypothetical protein ERJ75_001480400 [Trypanosoma vivax]|nr:hypothetical protein ERJ75_001480400 [Trypanosoma vivax]
MPLIRRACQKRLAPPKLYKSFLRFLQGWRLRVPFLKQKKQVFPDDVDRLNAVPGPGALSGRKPSARSMPGPTGLRRARGRGYRRGGVQHHRRPGVNEVVRLLPRAGVLGWMRGGSRCLSRGRLAQSRPSDARGQVKLWGLTRAKRVAVERKVHEDMLLLCLLRGARLASAERAALSIGGCQHARRARTPYRGGAPILARDGAGVEAGVLDRKVPGRATVTLRPSAGMCLTIASAHFPRKAGVSSASMNTLPGASAPLVAGARANSHHVLWDPFRPSDDKGERIVDWCVENGLSIANAGSAARRQPGRQHCRHWTSRFVETARSAALSPH